MVPAIECSNTAKYKKVESQVSDKYYNSKKIQSKKKTSKNFISDYLIPLFANSEMQFAIILQKS